MNTFIKQIFESCSVLDSQGVSYPLHSNIGYEDGLFIQKIINEHEIQKSLEIGCAFGISSLFICDALSKKISQ